MTIATMAALLREQAFIYKEAAANERCAHAKHSLAAYGVDLAQRADALERKTMGVKL